MDYSKRNKVKIYHSGNHNQYSEDENFPHRVRKPVAVLMVLVMLAILALTLEFFK